MGCRRYCLTLLLVVMAGTASAEVVGWRGDGSGRFPKATPPLSWSLKGGAKSNIVWKTEMPYYSPASVIASGEFLFTTCNPGLLVCIQKRTGKILWAKPVSPYDALTPEDRKKDAAAFAELDKVAAQRDALIAKIASAGSPFKLGSGLSKIQQKMDKGIQKIDPEGHPKTGMVYSDGGYMSTTPASDGEFVYAWNGWGVTAAFDMAGRRQWIRYDKLLAQEHGHHGSPLVMGDRLIVYLGKRYMALEAKTGRELWRSENHRPGNFAGYWYGSHVPGVVGGEPIFAAGDGSLIRVRDGVRFLKGSVHQGAPSPIIGGGFVVWMNGVGNNPLMYCALPRTTSGSANASSRGRGFNRGGSGYMQSSPLYDKGLVYVMGTKPVLTVHDLAADKTVYQKKLDFEPPQNRRDRPYGCGVQSSPSFAGGRIYIWGSFGTALVIEPGRQYKQLAKNTIEMRFDYNYKKNILEGTASSPFFEGNHIYYRAQKYMYCIGEPGKPFTTANAPKPKKKPVAKPVVKKRPKAAPRPVRKLTDEQKAKGLLSGAENYVRAGMDALARKKLSEIVAKYPETAAAGAAKERLAKLDGDE